MPPPGCFLLHSSHICCSFSCPPCSFWSMPCLRCSTWEKKAEPGVCGGLLQPQGGIWGGNVHRDGSYQVEGALELGQHVLAAAAGALQLAQRVLEGSVPQLGRERAQAHKVALLLLLLLRFEALHGRGQFGCGRGAAEVVPPLPTLCRANIALPRLYPPLSKGTPKPRTHLQGVVISSLPSSSSVMGR